MNSSFCRLNFVYVMAVLMTAIFSINNSNAGSISCQTLDGNGSCVQTDSNLEISKLGVDQSTKDLFEGTNSVVNRSTIWVSKVVDSVFRLIAPNGSIPYDSISYVRNSNPNLDIDINVGSNLFPYKSGNATVVTSLVNNLKLYSDGKDGTKGRNSSEICSDVFRNGSLGSGVKDYWQSRSSALDQGKCVQPDIDYLYQNSFSCPVGYKPAFKEPLNVVEYDKVIMKKRCSSRIDQPVCLGKTVDLDCDIKIRENVCCNENKTWTNAGSFINHPPVGATCDPTKCVQNLVDDDANRSGDVLKFMIRIFDKYIDWKATRKQACVDELARHKRMRISYNKDYYDEELGITRFHPIYQVRAERPSNMANGTDNKFTIPLFDNIESFNGDSTAPEDLRYYITGIDSVMAEDPRNILKNCLGLDGSNPWKLTCERVSGPSFWINIGLIDKFGNKSNSVKIKIPEGRFGWQYTMTANVPPGTDNCGRGPEDCRPLGRTFEFRSADTYYFTIGGIPQPPTGPTIYSTFPWTYTDEYSGNSVTVNLPFRWDVTSADGEYFAFCAVPFTGFNPFCSKHVDPIKYYY